MRLDKGCGYKDKKKKKKNLVKNLRIQEVSSVRRGANEGALVTLMKTADDLEDNEPKLEKKETEDMKKAEEIQKELDELKAAHSEQADKLAKSEFLASLNDLQKTHYQGLEGEEKEAFEKASDEDRTKLAKEAIAKAEAAEEILEVNGQEVRKSVIGDEGFELLKAEKERTDKLAKELEEKKTAEIKKMENDEAEKNLPHLGGKPEAKAKLWKMACEDEDLMEVVKGADKQAEDMMVEKGVSSATHADDEEPASQLHKMVQAKMNEKNISEPLAWVEVMKSEEGRKLYKG